MGKVFEKLIVNRLSWELYRDGGLSQRQYGFMPQKSTEDALYDAVAYIRAGLKRKKLVALVSLDIEGAFNGVWWPAVIEELRGKAVDERIFRVICSYLEDRTVTLNYLGEQVTAETERGCIHGSIGGPFLWNLLLDPLLRRFRADSGRAHLQAFADDILVMATAGSTADLNDLINSALVMVSEWGQKTKMKFAAQKTQAMLVTKRLKFDVPAFVLGSTTLPLQSEMKLLGLTIDRALGFRSHLESVTTKVLNLYKIVSRMAKAQWGLNADIIRTMFHTVVEPTILYAAGAWGEVAEREYVRKRLDRVTRVFALRISKAHRTVSLTSGVFFARILPLDLRLREHLELYRVKRGKPMSKLPGRLLQVRAHPALLPHPAQRRRLAFGQITSSEDVRSIQDERHCFYTDGSKIGGRVGAVITVWGGERKLLQNNFRLENFCTVFQAEIVAIYRATELAIKRGTSAYILSDSRSALQAVCDPSTQNPITIEIQERSAEVSGIAIGFFWLMRESRVTSVRTS